jgi:hypothetical protein
MGAGDGSAAAYFAGFDAAALAAMTAAVRVAAARVNAARKVVAYLEATREAIRPGRDPFVEEMSQAAAAELEARLGFQEELLERAASVEAFLVIQRLWSSSWTATNGGGTRPPLPFFDVRLPHGRVLRRRAGG